MVTAWLRFSVQMIRDDLKRICSQNFQEQCRQWTQLIAARKTAQKAEHFGLTYFLT
jgi:hypothetical protein